MTVCLEFRGQECVFLNDTQESRLLAALLGAANHFLMYEEAGREIGAGRAGGSQNAALRQVKCRLNGWLRNALGPALLLDSSEPDKLADWVICHRKKGYLLNPAVKFVPKDESSAGYVSTGRRLDVGTWVTDRTKPDETDPDDEPATGLAPSANPYLAAPSTAWKRDRQARVQTSPLLKSIRPRTRPDG